MPRRATRIRWAAKALVPHLPAGWAVEANRLAGHAVDAAGPSEPMGTSEVLETLGVTDLRKVAGLPKPVKVLKAGPVYDADAIRDLARERKRNPPNKTGNRRWNGDKKRRG